MLFSAPGPGVAAAMVFVFSRRMGRRVASVVFVGAGEGAALALRSRAMSASTVDSVYEWYSRPVQLSPLWEVSREIECDDVLDKRVLVLGYKAVRRAGFGEKQPTSADLANFALQ